MARESCERRGLPGGDHPEISQMRQIFGREDRRLTGGKSKTRPSELRKAGLPGPSLPPFCGRIPASRRKAPWASVPGCRARQSGPLGMHPQYWSTEGGSQPGCGLFEIHLDRRMRRMGRTCNRALSTASVLSFRGLPPRSHRHGQRDPRRKPDQDTSREEVWDFSSSVVATLGPSRLDSLSRCLPKVVSGFRSFRCRTCRASFPLTHRLS